MQTNSFLQVALTPYANGFGRLPALRQVPSGFSSAHTLSYQTLVPPSHGRFSGKFAPPATRSASPLTAANIAAKPSRSGSAGNRDHSNCCALMDAEENMPESARHPLTKQFLAA